MTLREFVDRYCNGRKKAFTLFARMTPPCVTEKFCPDCQTRKPLAEFTKHSHHPDGYNSTCVVCKNVRRRLLHAEKERAYRMRQYHANRDAEVLKMREWQKANREILRQSCRNWRAKHPDRQAAAERSWRLRNPEKHRFYATNRRAAKLQRTPPWLTEKQLAEIEDFYHLAEALNQVCDEFYEVDHIVPMRGETVSGLHVPWNLQLLTMRENCVKGNRYEPQ